MPEFTVTRRVDAPVEKVWEVLDDFGDIARWNTGVKASALTSSGPVGEGTTRHCALSPVGAVDERIDTYAPVREMGVAIVGTSALPISSAVAVFRTDARDGGTALTISYSYEFNRVGRMAKGLTEKRLRKGVGGLADDLRLESERVAAG